MYDGLVAHDLGRVLERLQRAPEALRGSLYFIENHDEPRAATVFSIPDQLASAALILSIPGSVLIHQGQMEGIHERLPVQRIKPLEDESPDLTLQAAYKDLLTVTSDDVFKNGEFQIFDPHVYGALGFIRKDQRRIVSYLGQISDAWHRFNSPPMDLSTVAQALGAKDRMRLTNLINSRSAIVHPNNGEFHIPLSQLGVGDESKFCLLEASPDRSSVCCVPKHSSGQLLVVTNSAGRAVS